MGLQRCPMQRTGKQSSHKLQRTSGARLVATDLCPNFGNATQSLGLTRSGVQADVPECPSVSL
eukprot:5603913-Amphidinium_carterae.2